jgi:hypothetical protein
VDRQPGPTEIQHKNLEGLAWPVNRTQIWTR